MSREKEEAEQKQCPLELKQLQRMNRNNLCRLQQPDHQPSDGADDHAAAECYCCPVIDKGLWRNNPNMTSTPEQGDHQPWDWDDGQSAGEEEGLILYMGERKTRTIKVE